MNNRLIQTPDHWVDIERDRVTLDDKPVLARERVYILLYKPKGFLTSYGDPEGRPTVYQLIEDLAQWVIPVGRLDQATSGLLILTNDTHFANRIMDPEFKVPKTYLVKCSTLLTDEQIARLSTGVELTDGPTRPAQVRRVRDSNGYTHIEITITEGRNRQVRRMVEAIGSKVLKLVRTAIGPIHIGRLEIGKYRELTKAERTLLLGQR